jgi:hypothetical protein
MQQTLLAALPTNNPARVWKKLAIQLSLTSTDYTPMAHTWQIRIFCAEQKPRRSGVFDIQQVASLLTDDTYPSGLKQ